MKLYLNIELELEPTYYEDNNGNVRLEMLRFPNSTHNVMPFLSQSELVRAQAELENAVEQYVIDKAIAIAERREMAGDYRRELAMDMQREALREGAAQRRLGA